MSSVPTGSVVPSMRAIFWASRWARVTPRVRKPTKVTSLAPPFFSRISWAIRVSARSSADSSRTSAFSRNLGGPLLISAPCEPRWARLKEFTAPTTNALYPESRARVTQLPYSKGLTQVSGGRLCVGRFREGRLPTGLGICNEARHLSEMGVAEQATLHAARHRVHTGSLERRLGEEQVTVGVDRVLQQSMRQDDVRPGDAGVSADDLADEAPVVGDELEV